jgi:hypothetical protein
MVAKLIVIPKEKKEREQAAVEGGALVLASSGS